MQRGGTERDFALNSHLCVASKLHIGDCLTTLLSNKTPEG